MRMLAVAPVALAVLAVAGCGGSSSKGASSPAEAVQGFIAGVQKGDGETACSYVQAFEQKMVVIEAGALSPPVAGKTCAEVFSSLGKKLGTTASGLSGTLNDVVISGTFANGNWVYADGSGQQAVMLVKGKDGWQLASGRTDFPTAVLHFADGS